jgi:hypothetical protein
MNGNEREREKSDPAAMSLIPFLRNRVDYFVSRYLIIKKYCHKFFIIGIKPWYQIKSARILFFSFLAILVFWYMFYRPVDVNRGPWQVLDPGQPVKPVKFEVVEEGSGPVVEPGDLIQISLWYWSIEHNLLERRNNDWWIWVGFRTEEETLFYSIGPSFVSAFVGLKEGGGIKFLRERDPGEHKPGGYKTGVREQLYLNPFGASYSIWRNPIGKGEGYIYISHGAYYYLASIDVKNPPEPVYIPASTGYTVVHIKKVFKGQLRYRTTRLYDRTWFFACYNFLSACEFNDEPREAWYDDARYDGASADGQRATFRYGPVPTPRQPWRSPYGIESLAAWYRHEWKNLPVGVQVE